MSSTGIATLDESLHDTAGWLRDVGRQLGTTDRRLAYGALKTTLHAVRDGIGADNAIHFGAQLPLLLKGVLFEDWEPQRVVTRAPGKFVNKAARNGGNGSQADSEAALRAGFGVLAARLPPGARSKLTRLFPAHLRELWPEPLE